ncbi:MAG TPA: hypothetical protein VGD14_08225 [bacterium]
MKNIISAKKNSNYSGICREGTKITRQLAGMRLGAHKGSQRFL